MQGNGILAEKAGMVKLNLEAHVLQGDRYESDTSPLLKESLNIKDWNVIRKE